MGMHRTARRASRTVRFDGSVVRCLGWILQKVPGSGKAPSQAQKILSRWAAHVNTRRSCKTLSVGLNLCSPGCSNYYACLYGVRYMVRYGVWQRRCRRRRRFSSCDWLRARPCCQTSQLVYGYGMHSNTPYIVRYIIVRYLTYEQCSAIMTLRCRMHGRVEA